MQVPDQLTCNVYSSSGLTDKSRVTDILVLPFRSIAIVTTDQGGTNPARHPSALDVPQAGYDAAVDIWSAGVLM